MIREHQAETAITRGWGPALYGEPASAQTAQAAANLGEYCRCPSADWQSTYARGNSGLSKGRFMGKAQNSGGNTQLQHWFGLTGFARKELAGLVCDRAATQGEPNVRPDESRVRRWLLAGEIPRSPVPEIIADLFSERLGIPLTPADLGLPGPDRPVLRSGVDLPWHSASTTTAIANLTRTDMMLNSNSDDAAVVLTGDALTRPLERWPYAEPSVLSPREQPFTGQVGRRDVDGIRELTAMFRDADNRLGGGMTRKAVVATMHDANALLSNATYTEDVGRLLFRAIADLGSVAGWMSFDAGRHGSAQRLFVVSLHAATEGGDKALGAHILQCMARQMSHLGRVKDALDLLALAQYGSRHQAGPATKALLAGLEARFRGIDGHLPESDAAAAVAEAAFERIGDYDSVPDYLRWFDRSELCATLGIAHQIAARQSSGDERLRRAERATAMLTEAMSLRPPGRRRSTAFDRIGLARTHLAIGELDGAAEQARTALSLLTTLTSARVGDRLTELREEMTPFAAHPPIRDLREEIDTALAAAVA
ncbi:transcriptional regulator [Kitasatospora griseola]|uniref:transcriptional regulator n=1 Tax=Kitasatospora griseola TaxID=2064 RepID=UPI003F4D7349